MNEPGASVALLTPPGRGALAVIGLRGPAATDIVARLFLPRGASPLEWPSGRLGVGAWRGVASPGSGAIAPEEVVAVRTDDGWEIHCHGGLAAPEAILGDLVGVGAILVPPGAWVTGAGTAAEAIHLFPAARGLRPARILARQHAGALDTALADLAMLAASDPDAAAARADRLLAAARVGLRVVRPWRVAFTGTVNAGKSSLVNALAGHARSIVSPHPGTTRDVVETPVVLGGWGVVLIDTAGMSEGGARAVDSTERAGQERALEAIGSADLVVRVVASGSPVPERGDEELVVVSKGDLAGRAPDAHPSGGVVTSAVTGHGIDDLADSIVDRLVPEQRRDPPLLEGPVPFLERHVGLIRGIVRDPATRQ